MKWGVPTTSLNRIRMFNRCHKMYVIKCMSCSGKTPFSSSEGFAKEGIIWVDESI